MYLAILSLLSSVSFAAQLQLTPLKPMKPGKKSLGRISVSLINSRDESVVDSLSAVIGDCAGCARGVAVKGVLGIRFEGERIEKLKVVKKSSVAVRYRDCKQVEVPVKGEYSCTFSFGKATYTVKLSAEKATRKN